MGIGSLIRFLETDSTRETGIVTRFSTHHPDSSSTIIRIAEILWSSGKVGWIDVSRIETLELDEVEKTYEYIV